MNIHKKITITGQVQGVFFRQTAKKLADELGLHGYIQNSPDGNVTVEVEGDSDRVEKFIDWCKIGPQGAKVTNIYVEERPLDSSSDFSIRP